MIHGELTVIWGDYNRIRDELGEGKSVKGGPGGVGVA